MNGYSIPVELRSAGQVFACLGFLEAAGVLCGEAEGKFDWGESDADVRFCLRANGTNNPFETVLGFLASAEFNAMAPRNWRPKKDPAKEEEPKSEEKRKKWEKAKQKVEDEILEQVKSDTFPVRSPKTSFAMPVEIAGQTSDGRQVEVLGHWADGSSRNEFKLYAGNRSALSIAKAMLSGTFAAPRNGQNIGNLKTKGLRQLWEDGRTELVKSPFDVLTPMTGTFNFDPRGAWTAIDAGYSPNDQSHQVASSPVVEILAAWGLENARPQEFDTRKVRYSVWGHYLPPMLARAALCASLPGVPVRRFRFDLELAGKNKIVTYSEEEITHA